MKYLKFALCSLAFAATVVQASVRYETCKPESASDAALYSNDFRWGYSLPDLISRFVETYASEKRLKRRAYIDPQSKNIKLPYTEYRGGDLIVNPQFIDQVAKHIEAGFQQQVIDGVFFPDMGHSHFLIPTERYQNFYDKIPVDNFKKFYETFFSDTTVKILYHTAEQLAVHDSKGQLIPDERLQYRFKTRNLVGSNNGSRDIEFLQNPESSANTASGMPGYKYWGAGFNLSANENGCFSYDNNGETFYFDLSMFDLELDPNMPVDKE